MTCLLKSVLIHLKKNKTMEKRVNTKREDLAVSSVIKFYPHKHVELSSNPRIHIKKQNTKPWVWLQAHVIITLGKPRQGNPCGLLTTHLD